MAGHSYGENHMPLGEAVVDVDSQHYVPSHVTANEGSPPMSGAESVHGDHAFNYSNKNPQVIVRIRPSPNVGNGVFEVDSETKTIQIRIDRENKSVNGGKKPPPGFIYFSADDVLENSSQEDTSQAVVQDIAERACEGSSSSMIVAVGPENSGKSFSLFGLNGRYRNRGIVPRVMEKLFDMKNKISDRDFRFGLGIIEVRRERIRDLLTLDPHEINDVGDRGPKGMYVEEVDCLEHGLGLLLRSLIGQKLIHKEPYERFHTIVYLEIVAISPDIPELVFFESRITFAEIASAPLDIVQPAPTNSCRPQPPPTPEIKFKFKQRAFPPGRCCNPGYTTGPMAETISVRRDIFALEQIFYKAHEMQRIRRYFTKFETLGLTMIASEKRRLASGHNFRQSRLAHCLKDILENGTNIRILLHVRPDKDHLKSSLEAMRFAERARLVPSNNSDSEGGKSKMNRTEEQILQEVITDIAPDLVHPNAVESLSVDKMKAIQEQAVQYFESNIDTMKICTKEKVKHMFENFRVLWNFLWELELNVSLRKAEEEMKETMVERRKGGGGSATGTEVEYYDHHVSSKVLVGKKSGKKIKKEKGKRNKKAKHAKRDSAIDHNEHHDQDNATTADTIQRRESTSQHHQEVGSPVNDDQSTKGSVHTQHPRSSHHDDSGSKKSHQSDHIRHSAAESTAVAPVTNEGEATTHTKPASPPQNRLSTANESTIPALSAIVVEPAEPTHEEEEEQALPEATGSAVNNPRHSDARSQATSALSPHPHYTNASSTHIPHAAHFRHSTFFLKGGFDDFKLQSHTEHHHHKEMTEEERAAFAAKQEQILSSNFEEMKKVARRQAIHLLRTVVKRPKWSSLF